MASPAGPNLSAQDVVDNLLHRRRTHVHTEVAFHTDIEPAPHRVTRGSHYPDLPDRVTVEEAAAYTGMARDTIRRWVREGRLRNVGFGKIIQIPKECFHPSRAPQQVTP